MVLHSIQSNHIWWSTARNLFCLFDLWTRGTDRKSYLDFVGKRKGGAINTRRYWQKSGFGIGGGHPLCARFDTQSSQKKTDSIPILGKHQNSDTLIQLRSLVSNRRRTPNAGVGFWRWGMTLIGGISEIVVHFF